jgi:hypothetical protein
VELARFIDQLNPDFLQQLLSMLASAGPGCIGASELPGKAAGARGRDRRSAVARFTSCFVA